MPTESDRGTSRPDLLHTISDADKAAAISSVCKALTGHNVDTRIEMIDYNGRFHRRGPFREYAEFRFALFTIDKDIPSDEVVNSLQQIDDDTLASSIAAKLSKMTGEHYRGYITTRRLSIRARQTEHIGHVSIQLAAV